MGKKMKKLILPLLALVVFSAVSATAAYAETEFLVNGGVIAEGSKIPFLSETMENLLLEDTKGGPFGEKVDLLCSGLNVGTLENKVLGLITSVTDLAEKNPIACTTDAGICPEPLVTALNLPWHFELALVGGALRVKLLNEAGKIPAYEANCGGVIDVCEAEAAKGESSLAIESSTEGTLLSSFLNTPTGFCSRGLAGSAVVEGGDILFFSDESLVFSVNT
jgi:hypothetical protein